MKNLEKENVKNERKSNLRGDQVKHYIYYFNAKSGKVLLRVTDDFPTMVEQDLAHELAQRLERVERCDRYYKYYPMIYISTTY